MEQYDQDDQLSQFPSTETQNKLINLNNLTQLLFIQAPSPTTENDDPSGDTSIDKIVEVQLSDDIVEGGGRKFEKSNFIIGGGDNYRILEF